MNDFDAIVVGSGITGGWAAKELTQKGLRVLMIERGRPIEHGEDYKTEMLAPWELPYRGFGNKKLFDEHYPVQSKGGGFNEWTAPNYVVDTDNPYQSNPEHPFNWRRGYQLGGKSIIWGRQCYRWSDTDFSANAADGHGTDWPIRYADLKPWYDYVENFIGVSGSREGLDALPDGEFQPPMALNAVETALKGKIAQHYQDRRLIIGRTANLTEEKEGRTKCQYRNQCGRGCSFGAYFSTQSSTLPAARETGRLTVMTDSLVESLDYDPVQRRVSGVRVLDTKTRKRSTFNAKIVFLCAGTINSVSVLLRSKSESYPNGLTNSHDVLGRYLMDHALATSILAEIPGFDNHGYFGNRPSPVIVPRFLNTDNRDTQMLRGYSFQGMAYRRGWARGATLEGIGAPLKQELHHAGPWNFLLAAFAEALPEADNRITLDPHARDSFGLEQTHIEFRYGANEDKLLRHAQEQARQMMALIGGKVITTSHDPGPGGSAVHEMGGARMGRDPATSILNAHNQAHGIANLFVTDGAAMASSASQNPSLTYMALTARAVDHAVGLMKAGHL